MDDWVIVKAPQNYNQSNSVILPSLVTALKMLQYKNTTSHLKRSSLVKACLIWHQMHPMHPYF